MLVGAGFKPALSRQGRSREIVRVILPTRRIIRNVIANAIERFLITNDVLVIATLPHGAAPAGTFIDATGGERLEPLHDFGNAAARLRLIGEDDDSVHMVRHDNERVEINATVM